MNLKLSAAILLVLGFLTSCSIKEKRCNCPCYMMLDFSQVDTMKILSARVQLFAPDMDADSFFYTSDLTTEDFRKPLVIEVPRTDIQINVFSGDDGLFSSKGGLVIPEGEDCPPIHMHSALVNTESDTVTDTVRLYKNYCLLSVGMIADGKSKPFDIGVKGNICGYMDNGVPMDGEFLVVSNLPAGERNYVKLPRQTDASLALQILDEGKLVREFALGEYIVSSGYDWTAKDLGDIDVTVDFALAEVVLKINEWETRYVYGVEI